MKILILEISNFKRTQISRTVPATIAVAAGMKSTNSGKSDPVLSADRSDQRHTARRNLHHGILNQRELISFSRVRN